MSERDGQVRALTVVDDEPVVLDLLVRAAGVWQYPCRVARDAAAALRLLEEHPTPVVVTDLAMPGADGVWLVREIHRRWPEVFVIVLTAGMDLDAAVRCLNAGAYRYFLKPVRLDAFHHALESAFRAHELRRENERYRDHLEYTV